MLLSEGSRSIIKSNKNQGVIILFLELFKFLIFLLRLKHTNKKIILVFYTGGNKLLEEKIVINEHVVVTRL